jgi:hypothetical protein
MSAERETLRTVFGLALCIKEDHLGGFEELIRPYGLDEEQHALVRMLVAALRGWRAKTTSATSVSTWRGSRERLRPRDRQGTHREPPRLRRLPALWPGTLGCRPRARQHLDREPLEALPWPSLGSGL